MKSKTPAAGSRARKILLPENHTRHFYVLFFDERWSKIRAAIPDQLSAGREENLRKSISDCCSQFVSRVRLIEEGAATAAAVRKGGGKQASPLERLTKSLKTAALAWTEIRKMHDDRRGILSDYGDRLSEMAVDAERRLNAIQDLGEAKPMAAVKSGLVRAIAECCLGVGLNPTATGRVSEEEAPTWFQKFMVVLNNQILGDNGWGLVESDHKARAVHSDVAKALSGYAKPGIPRE
jgi:hypothetical protein